MEQTLFTLNILIYGVVIAYILYINFSAYYNKSTGFLNSLINLFQNWLFRLIFLLVVGFFALDLYPQGGFILAVLLTIAFLNTNMLSYKKNMTEKFQEYFANPQPASDAFDLSMQKGVNDSQDYLQPVVGAPIDFENDAEYQGDGEAEGQAEYEDTEPFANKRKEMDESEEIQRPENCGPYAPLQRLPFNPQGFDDPSIDNNSYTNDLPEASMARGDYTDSPVGYAFNMA